MMNEEEKYSVILNLDGSSSPEKTNHRFEKEEWLSNFPEHLRSFFWKMKEGYSQPLDFSALSSAKPDWLDEEKVKRGQNFAKKYYFSVNLMGTTMLFLLFADKYVKKSFLFFDNINTPFKMLRRQLRIASDLQSCYETDIWGSKPDSPKSIFKKVLKSHKYFDGRLGSYQAEHIDEKISSYDEKISSKLFLYKKVQSDFENSCDKTVFHQEMTNRTLNIFFSQTNFMWLQFSFLGLAINNPRFFGFFGASEDDWDAYVHLWRAIGYLLGVRDEYNFCNADLATVKHRSKLLMDLYVKCLFKKFDASWEYVLRCAIDGAKLFAPIPVMSFESLFLFLCGSVGFQVPEFKKSVTFWQYFSYLLIRFLIFIQIIPGVSRLSGFIVYKLVMRGNKASPETLQKWKEKKFSYVVE